MKEKKRLLMSVELDPDSAELLALKSSESGRSKSEILRAALRKELQATHTTTRAEFQPESSKKAVIYLTSSERVRFAEIAKANGFTSWQKWSIALMRESAYGELPISPANSIKIDHAVYELAAIGKNINQVAKAINTAAQVQLLPVDVAKVRRIESALPLLKSTIADIVKRLAIPVRT
jgi:hypothetical protein